MDRSLIVEKIRAQEPTLRRLGVAGVSVFGSIARGEATDASDVDLAIRFDPAKRPRGLAYVGRLEELGQTLSGLIGRPVDIVVEPAQRAQLQKSIDEDRIVAF